MMKNLSVILLMLTATNLVPLSLVQAADDKQALQQQVDSLMKRVVELEQRLDLLAPKLAEEAGATPTAALLPIVVPAPVTAIPVAESARVAELEARLKMLEAQPAKVVVVHRDEESEPENPGDSTDNNNWLRLNIGHDYTDVRELIGEPLQIKRGAMELWFYSDKGLKGPHVKFLFKKVNGWRAPGAG